ncbi:MAG: hypothetical protein LBR51_02695 [Bacteroidales bacterium]|jgi:hypothetical protein|nr:hypothetical protein [Bacteroidales bacterium]
MCKKLSIYFILMLLSFGSVTVVYGQNCAALLQRATALESQKKYCEAKNYYQQYGACDADADVSSEIAMCDRYCKMKQGDSGNNGSDDRETYW